MNENLNLRPYSPPQSFEELGKIAPETKKENVEQSQSESAVSPVINEEMKVDTSWSDHVMIQADPSAEHTIAKPSQSIMTKIFSAIKEVGDGFARISGLRSLAKGIMNALGAREKRDPVIKQGMIQYEKILKGKEEELKNRENGMKPMVKKTDAELQSEVKQLKELIAAYKKKLNEPKATETIDKVSQSVDEQAISLYEKILQEKEKKLTEPPLEGETHENLKNQIASLKEVIAHRRTSTTAETLPPETAESSSIEIETEETSHQEFAKEDPVNNPVLSKLNSLKKGTLNAIGAREKYDEVKELKKGIEQENEKLSQELGRFKNSLLQLTNRKNDIENDDKYKKMFENIDAHIQKVDEEIENNNQLIRELEKLPQENSVKEEGIERTLSKSLSGLLRKATSNKLKENKIEPTEAKIEEKVESKEELVVKLTEAKKELKKIGEGTSEKELDAVDEDIANLKQKLRNLDLPEQKNIKENLNNARRELNDIWESAEKNKNEISSLYLAIESKKNEIKSNSEENEKIVEENEKNNELFKEKQIALENFEPITFIPKGSDLQVKQAEIRIRFINERSINNIKLEIHDLENKIKESNEKAENLSIRNSFLGVEISDLEEKNKNLQESLKILEESLAEIQKKTTKLEEQIY
ncbi:MAG: hypothetical protein H0V82_08380 [Candidatus Protochlamydia sp.]|nr:hypothetical protein [Candidatus Protochlamydia sp.]